MEAKSQYQHFIPRFVLRDFATDVPAGIGAGEIQTQPKPNRKPRNRRGGKGNKKKKKQQTKAAGSSGPGDGEAVAEVVDQLQAVNLEGSDCDTAEEGTTALGADKTKGKGKQVPTSESSVRNKQATGTPKPLGRPGNPQIDNDPRNPLIKVYNLGLEVLEERHVGQAYGNQDMYRDVAASDANHIEKQLAVLEGAASRVVRRVKDAQKARAATADIVQGDLNHLRKFLFVMKYRNNKFWKKYNCSMEEYTEVDKVETLKAILDTPIDTQGVWKQTLLAKAFEHDIKWYIFHMTESYLVLCEPDHADDEFIITENGFGIHEGPTFENTVIDPKTKAPIQTGSYTEYHKLAPLSPKLLLVLRSNSLQKGNEHMLRAFRATPHVPETPSLFEKLDLEAPAVSGEQSVQSSEAEDDRVFSFKVHKISREYTALFNAVLLEEARISITWVSDKAFKKTLRAYLENPIFRYPSGNIERKREAKMRLFGTLGGEGPKSPLSGFESELALNPQLKVYFKLGGKPETFADDMSRASRVSEQRRRSADNSPKGDVTARNANLRRDMVEYAKHPSRIIYFHIKMWRANANVASKRFDGNLMARLQDELPTLMDPGPEELIGHLASLIDEKHRSLMMLESSMKVFFRGVNRKNAAQFRMGKEETEAFMLDKEQGLFAQWGGISTSCFLEKSQFYSDIGKKIMESRRTTKIEADMENLFLADLQQRIMMKTTGFIEKRLLKANNTVEERQWLEELLWGALYCLPGEGALSGEGIEAEFGENEGGCPIS